MKAAGTGADQDEQRMRSLLCLGKELLGLGMVLATDALTSAVRQGV